MSDVIKKVTVIAYQFDSLPGHVQVDGYGESRKLPVALCEAIRTIFKDRRLRHRHIRSFKMSIVVRVGGTKEFAEVHEVEVEDGKVED